MIEMTPGSVSLLSLEEIYRTDAPVTLAADSRQERRPDLWREYRFWQTGQPENCAG